MVKQVREAQAEKIVGGIHEELQGGRVLGEHLLGVQIHEHHRHLRKLDHELHLGFPLDHALENLDAARGHP